MKFIEDHRTTNPGLHNLHVGYALETLEVCERFLEELNGHSRISSSLICGDIYRHIREECERSAAWFEAAAIRYARIDEAPYKTDVVEDFTSVS
jgi:hypothetical protein